MGFGSGGGYTPSPNNVSGIMQVTGSLLITGSVAAEETLFQVESAKAEGGGNEPAFTIAQNSDGRWYTTVGQAPQTTYATAWNMSNGSNSTFYLSNGTVFMASGVNMVYAAPTVPASSTAAGITGQISWGDDGGTHYLYICTSGGGAGAATWKRVALSTF